MPHHESPNGTTPPGPSSSSFTGPPQTLPLRALLFDMDGTLIDSTPAIIKFWTAVGTRIGVPGPTILETSHGRRSIDVLKIHAPELANWEFVCQAEGEVPKMYGGDAVKIQGAERLMGELEGFKGVGGKGKGVPWAIVTSGTGGLVKGWLRVLGLAKPEVMVTAEEVARGKPDPAPYLLGAERLGFGEGKGVKGEEILVLEDAPSGVKAGKAAGFRVLALATTHKVEQLREAGADFIVEDLRSVRLVGWDEETGRVSVEVRDTLME